tara:strand:- start:1832 stop:2179 length:348 start_codon:yes stop_codon:yes gene_type:complete
MNKDLNIKNTMVPILNKIKKESFVEGYEATDTEAFGLLLSKYFKWSGYEIVEASFSALEDANFHELHKRFAKTYKDWENEEYDPDWEYGGGVTGLGTYIEPSLVKLINDNTMKEK